ncbi:hypothetical protein J8J40_24465, partial [Mycobacterium tuberculosis]|nr:hypothetical protein [Mycobacterium tuberculosis]
MGSRLPRKAPTNMTPLTWIRCPAPPSTARRRRPGRPVGYAVGCAGSRDGLSDRHPMEDNAMSDLRLIVVGAAGRMGQTVIRTVAATPGFQLAAAIERPGSN